MIIYKFSQFFFLNGLCRQTPLQLVKHDAFPPHLNFKCHAKMAQKFKCNKFLHLIFYLAIGICVFVMGLLGQTMMGKKKIDFRQCLLRIMLFHFVPIFVIGYFAPDMNAQLGTKVLYIQPYIKRSVDISHE